MLRRLALVLILVAFAAGTAYGGRLYGYVYLEGETDHSGTKVKVWRNPFYIIVDSTYTDRNGYYEFPGLLGYYDIVYSHTGWVRETRERLWVPLIRDTVIPSFTLQRGLIGKQSGVLEPRASTDYPVLDNIWVEAGKQLEIRPGTRLLFRGHYKLDVYGQLIAIGTEQDSIVFTKYSLKDKWWGIRFHEAEDGCILEYCRIQYGRATYGGNVGDENGGAIFSKETILTIRNCSIRNNTAEYEGGGIHFTLCDSALVERCAITSNSASNGGGICCDGSSPTLINCTISRNSADDGCGVTCYSIGPEPYPSADVTAKNTTVYDNLCWDNPIYVFGRASFTATYSDIQDGWPGTGNIDCNPLFDEDYHLTWENYPIPDSTKSCCIDAGDRSSYYNDPDGTRNDIGAFYFHQGEGVAMACSCYTPVFCRGKHLYFSVTVYNETGDDINGTLFFSGYRGHNCDPDSVLVSIPRERTYPDGRTENHYFFKVPNAAGPGEYSISVIGTLSGYGLSCCMNTEIIECSPWKMGSNTDWQLVELDHPEVETSLPTVTSLSQNFPNPFNATTVINYQLAVSDHVKLDVYNLLGEKVITLVDEKQETGYKSVRWDASQVSSGLYFYRLTASDYTECRRMMLVK